MEQREESRVWAGVRRHGRGARGDSPNLLRTDNPKAGRRGEHPLQTLAVGPLQPRTPGRGGGGLVKATFALAQTVFCFNYLGLPNHAREHQHSTDETATISYEKNRTNKTNVRKKKRATVERMPSALQVDALRTPCHRPLFRPPERDPCPMHTDVQS